MKKLFSINGVQEKHLGIQGICYTFLQTIRSSHLDIPTLHKLGNCLSLGMNNFNKLWVVAFTEDGCLPANSVKGNLSKTSLAKQKNLKFECSINFFFDYTKKKEIHGSQ